jgi:hypothetical protein
MGTSISFRELAHPDLIIPYPNCTPRSAGDIHWVLSAGMILNCTLSAA